MRIENETKIERIGLAHGSGGKKMQRLIKEVILRYLDSGELAHLDDAAEVILDEHRLAFSTDTFVVKPIFFPGGDIGSLAVSGTVNDILMQGARPSYLSLSFIMEEGFPLEDLVRILESIQRTSKDADVRVVTGDTKVVGREEMDGIFINTSGIGLIPFGVNVSCENARIGDAIIVSGDIGRHGMAIVAQRNGLRLKGKIKSDAAPLNEIVPPLLERFGEAIHVLRDPTRGGIGTALNEIAVSSKVDIILNEPVIPVSEQVDAVCSILGFDPLYLPCEGRFLAFIENAVVEEALLFLCSLNRNENVSKIGEVRGKSEGEVRLMTCAGGQRLLDIPSGEMLPRIC